MGSVQECKNPQITCAEDLITSHEETRAGFINFALEKNRKSTPYIEQAKTFRQLASKAKTPNDLLKIDDIQGSLLTAAGLSDKALQYFTKEDKEEAIKKLIEHFLEPAGEYFVAEAVYRFLLIKGDSLGGSMRNLVGAMGEQRLRRFILAALSVKNIDFKWLPRGRKKWRKGDHDDLRVAEDAKAIYWENNNKHRVFAMNLKIPVVDKNVDLCLFNSNIQQYKDGAIVNDLDKIIMLGELKSGIDPAGADEHWKTANTALERIRTSFSVREKPVMTAFVGAAIEKSMANEIFNQYKSGVLTNVANLSNDNQMIEFSNWLISK